MMADLFANLCLMTVQRSSEFEAARAGSEDFARQLAAADIFRMFAPHAMSGGISTLKYRLNCRLSGWQECI